MKMLEKYKNTYLQNMQLILAKNSPLRQKKIDIPFDHLIYSNQSLFFFFMWYLERRKPEINDFIVITIKL